jgi:8-oxo-dGTP pyrophosphatase MutT (NUDIX family)
MRIGDPSPQWAQDLVDKWIIFDDDFHGIKNVRAFVFHTDSFENDRRVRIFAETYDQAMESLVGERRPGLYATYVLPDRYQVIETPSELEGWTAQQLNKNAASVNNAAIMLLIKDGLILAISRRHDRTKFGLPGGKQDQKDECPKDAALREIFEETSLQVKKATFIYRRLELGDGANPVDFESYTYYAQEWEGEPTNSEEGDVKWLTAEELTSTKAAFGDYNRNMLDQFKILFPDIYLIGESNEDQ